MTADSSSGAEGGGPDHRRDAAVLSTLTNGLAVLELLVEHPHTLRQLAKATGLPRQNAYRIVHTLVVRGWVNRRGEEYHASPLLWSLAARSFDVRSLRDGLAPVVTRLATTYGETVHLAIHDGGSVVYIDKADGSHPVGSYTVLGGRAPVYCVATGKAMLAFAPQDVRDAVLDGDLVRFTTNTFAERDGLRRELASVRATGYATNNGEWRAGVGGLAVPVFSPLGHVVAALGFSGPADRLLARASELVPVLRQAAGGPIDQP